MPSIRRENVRHATLLFRAEGGNVQTSGAEAGNDANRQLKEKMNIKMMKVRFATLIAAIAAFVVHADTETVDGYTWTYSVNGETAEIQSGITPAPTGDLIIPSTLGGKLVTSIGEWTFHRCSGLTSVTIPSSVTNIREAAFYGCTGLTSVTIPDERDDT